MTGERTRKEGGDVREGLEESERQSGWFVGRRASPGKLSGLGSVKIHLNHPNLVQEVGKFILSLISL